MSFQVFPEIGIHVVLSFCGKSVFVENIVKTAGGPD
jgi:hypothetical protein